MKKNISVDEMVIYLNSLLKIDRQAIAALLANRVPCNQALADHKSVQVQAQNGGFHVGMFGIINGLFSAFADGFGQIMYVFDDDGNLSHFATVDPSNHAIPADKNKLAAE